MSGFDWSRFAVGGAAARPDSFTGLNPDYAARVAMLMQAAEQELGPGALKITSAYRSPEVQARLWEGALQKYGSPEAARKWVAPPGRSMHNRGLAVDFADASGSLLRDANSREAQWIAANAARFGLDVPMSWEPWQVELAGSRGGPGPSGPPVATDGTSNALAVAPPWFEYQGQQPGQPPQDPRNALGPQEPQLRMVDTRQDPSAFFRQGNALAMAPIMYERRNSLGSLT